SGAWVNNGTISANNATIQFGGTLDPSSKMFAGITRVGGVARLNGTLTNTGSTFTFDNIGSWEVSGTIIGGTLAAAPGASVSVTNLPVATPAVFDNVTLDMDLPIQAGATLDVRNGLTLNGRTISMGGTGGPQTVIEPINTMTIGGTGTILFDSSPNNFLRQTTG